MFWPFLWPFVALRWIRQMASPNAFGPLPSWAVPWSPVSSTTGRPQYWLEEFYKDYVNLRNAVARLELVVHCNDPNQDKGRPIIAACPGGGPSGSGSPPPPKFPP
jgi:hypothetical protein